MVLKVCQLCAVDFTVDKFLLPLIDAMTAAGWRVTTVCSDGPYVPGLRAAGYDVRTIPIARSMNAVAHLRALVRLVRHLKREAYDVLHAHTPVAALVGRIAAWIAGTPIVVYTAHGFYFHDEMPIMKRRFFIWLERLGGRFTDFLFTQSAEDAEAAVRYHIMPPARVLAIGNGVNVERFDPDRVSGAEVRARFRIPHWAAVVGIVGRMVREKGFCEFLEAAERVSERHPNTYFLIVGERLASDHDVAIDRHIARAVERLGNRLVLAGMQEDVPAMFAAMNVFCLPSYREGMPRTIIEAMMMAKPVVATNIRGSREEVIDDVTGYLVPTRDPVALADKVSELLANTDLAIQMGAEGRRHSLTLFDERRVVEKQIYALRLLIEETPVGSANGETSRNA